MHPVAVVLPSPLLGPAVWRPAAAALRNHGWTVVEAGPPGRTPQTPADVLDEMLAGFPTSGDLLLVLHSNAGLYAPALAAHHPVGGFVFVDAGLPPAYGEFPLAPQEFRAFLADLADPYGTLPPWQAWWGQPVEHLYPDADTQRAVEREARRLPLSYFAATMTAEPGWDSRPGAYLAFGDTYEEDRAAAASRAWPVRTMPGHHLHLLIDPAGVAAEISALATAVVRADAWRS